MKIVTINDPVLEFQLEEMCKANMLDITEQVTELLSIAVFGIPEPTAEEIAEIDANPKVKAKVKKSDA